MGVSSPKNTMCPVRPGVYLVTCDTSACVSCVCICACMDGCVLRCEFAFSLIFSLCRRTNGNGACLWLAVASAHRLLKILSSSPFFPERAAMLYLSTMSSPLIHDFLFSAASLWAVLRGGLFPVTKPVPFFGSGPDTDALSFGFCVDENWALFPAKSNDVEGTAFFDPDTGRGSLPCVASE